MISGQPPILNGYDNFVDLSDKLETALNPPPSFQFYWNVEEIHLRVGLVVGVPPTYWIGWGEIPFTKNLTYWQQVFLRLA